MAPTAVMEVEAGTPTTFERNRANPMNSSTATVTVGSNAPCGTRSPPRVWTTSRPNTHPPASAKIVISTAAPTFETVLLPTAGPNATPVEEPPMLKPTNTATRRPAAMSGSITAGTLRWPDLSDDAHRVVR